MNEEIFGRWEQWLGTIRDDVYGIMHARHIFKEVQGIVTKNPALQKPNIFYEWMARSYAVTCAMGVRRQADVDQKAVSLMKLLRDMRKHATILTRERHVALYPSVMKEIAGKHFDHIARGAKNHVDPTLLQENITALQEAAKDLLPYATKTLAHLDANPPDKIPTYADLDKALDVVGTLFNRCKLILLAEGGDEVAPMILEPWKKIFDVPWRTPPSKAPK